MKIVSLLPSATEMLCALGLTSDLVGVTHECDYPASVLPLPKVTQTLIPTDATSAEIDQLVQERLQAARALYSLDLPVLEQLKPDLIVTQALCDVCAVAHDEVCQAALTLPGAPPVVNLEPETLDDVMTAMHQVAEAAGVATRAEGVVAGLRSRIDAVQRRSREAGLAERPSRVALLEWLDPPFSCGHWNPELVRLAGGVDGLGTEGQPSRRLTWAEVTESQPEVILIACCGFDVDRTLEDVPALSAVPGWDALPAVQTGRVFVTDGAQYFSRPGPRLVDSLEILAHAIDAEVHPLSPGLVAARRVGSTAPWARPWGL